MSRRRTGNSPCRWSPDRPRKTRTTDPKDSVIRVVRGSKHGVVRVACCRCNSWFYSPVIRSIRSATPLPSHGALASQGDPPEARRSSIALSLQVFQPALFFLQLFDRARARAIEASALNERHDLMQLAGIEEGAVAAADVDHRTRQLPEVHAVHHLPAPQARPVLHRPRGLFRGPGGQALEHGRLRLPLGAEPLEDVRVDPDAIAAGALEERRRADVNPLELAPAGRTLCPRVVFPGPDSRRATFVAIGRPLEAEREAGGAADGRQPGAAVAAAAAIRLGRRAAAGTPQRARIGPSSRYYNASAFTSAFSTSSTSALQRSVYGFDGFHQGRADRHHRVDR